MSFHQVPVTQGLFVPYVRFRLVGVRLTSPFVRRPKSPLGETWEGPRLDHKKYLCPLYDGGRTDSPPSLLVLIPSWPRLRLEKAEVKGGLWRTTVPLRTVVVLHRPGVLDPQLTGHSGLPDIQIQTGSRGTESWYRTRHVCLTVKKTV